jgi:hypothetical protein
VCAIKENHSITILLLSLFLKIEITFLFSRDDQEIFAGEYLSKIIVPHPALHFPSDIRMVTITYHVYRGWLTRGLSLWEINEVILSDSFGESFSICENIELESNVPVRVNLTRGDCHEEELLVATSTTTSTTTIKPKTMLNNKSSEIIELGKHMIIKNESLVSAAGNNKSLPAVTDKWKPIERANNNNNGNATENFLNTGERMPKKAKTEKRSFGEESEEEADNNTMMIRDDSASFEELNDDDNEGEMTSEVDADGKFITVQLFPYRLGDIFVKAEKYARNTLFPLLSEQISNIFNAETKIEKSASTGIGSNAITIVSKSNKPSTKSMRKFVDNEDMLTAAASERVERMTAVNTVQTLQQKLDKSQLIGDQLRPPIEKLLNSNSNENEKESVKIDLPTYKPPTRENDKIFIPIDRGIA